MKRQFSKLLASSLLSNVVEHLSEFSEVPREQRPTPAQGKLFFSKSNGGWTKYLFFPFHSKEDLFSVELAGSTGNEFPWNLGWHASAPAWDHRLDNCAPILDEAPYKSFRFFASYLWPPYKDQWWRVSSFELPDLTDIEGTRQYLLYGGGSAESEPDLLDESIADVISHVRRYALPYFVAVGDAIRKHGVSKRRRR